jgi:hypothetical protein
MTVIRCPPVLILILLMLVAAAPATNNTNARRRRSGPVGPRRHCMTVAAANGSTTAGRQGPPFVTDYAFPQAVPPDARPWIWDATYQRRTNEVDVTAVIKFVCDFNVSHWQALSSAYPEYRSQLADGDTNNILVSDDNDTDAPSTRNYAATGRRAKLLARFSQYSKARCQFWSSGVAIGETHSKQLMRSKAYSLLGTFQVRCRLSPRFIEWDSVSISIVVPNATSSLSSSVEEVRLQSEKFKVFRPESAIGFPNRSQYPVAVCSATNSRNRVALVEWLEYHTLLGVEHFYLYDTRYRPCSQGNNPPRKMKQQGSLRQVLKDYIVQGMVTVVAWPYSNCVNGMASGRAVHYHQEAGRRQGKVTTATSTEYFVPPVAIAQYAALSSCFSRYKETAKYLVHIDDDEFLSFSSPPVMSGTDRTTQPSRIAQFADYQFGLQPKRAAIAFMPVTLVPCAHDSRPVEAVAERTRLGLWQSHLRVRDFETKLLMRTDAVAMFHVHYVSALEDVHDGSAAGVARAEAVVLDSAHTVPLEMGAVLHYKLPAEWSGSVFGAVLPVNSKSSNFSTSCADCVVAALNALTTFYAAASSKTVVYPEEPNRFDGQIIDDARKRECLRLADFMAHPPHGQQSLFVRAEDMVDLKSLAATVKKRNTRSLYSSVYHRESAAPAPPG